MDLAQMTCTPYKTGSPPLIRREAMERIREVPGWSLADGRLTRTFTFPAAAGCFAFIADLGSFAAKEGHFPDISLREGRHVTVSFYTYPAGGLTLNDFIMAAKLNRLAGSR